VSDDAEAIGTALTEVNRQLGEFSVLDMFWIDSDGAQAALSRRRARARPGGR